VLWESVALWENPVPSERTNRKRKTKKGRNHRDCFIPPMTAGNLPALFWNEFASRATTRWVADLPWNHSEELTCTGLHTDSAVPGGKSNPR
jgi:hypothetical protein